jgi:hypothetical protein
MLMVWVAGASGGIPAPVGIVEEGWLEIDRKAPLGSGCDGLVWRGKLWGHVDVAVKEFFMLMHPETYGIEPGSREQAFVFAKITQEARCGLPRQERTARVPVGPAESL